MVIEHVRITNKRGLVCAGFMTSVDQRLREVEEWKDERWRRAKVGKQSDKLQKALVAFINSLFASALRLHWLISWALLYLWGGGYIQFLRLSNKYEMQELLIIIDVFVSLCISPHQRVSHFGYAFWVMCVFVWDTAWMWTCVILCSSSCWFKIQHYCALSMFFLSGF